MPSGTLAGKNRGGGQGYSTARRCVPRITMRYRSLKGTAESAAPFLRRKALRDFTEN